MALNATKPIAQELLVHARGRGANVAGVPSPCMKRFNGLTLLAYLNYVPRLQARIGHQTAHSRTRCVARAPIGKH